jgi:hypothetical protein
MTKPQLKLLVVAACLCTTLAHAQIQIGPKAGVNLNHTALFKRSTYALAFNAGGFARYDLTDFLNVQAEVVYSQLGTGYTSGYYYYRPSIYRDDVDVTFHTVAIPVFITVTLPSLAEASVTPRLLAGAEYAYAIKITESYRNIYSYRNDQVKSSRTSTDVTDNYDSHNIGLVLGAGASMELFGKKTFIDLRYRTALAKQNTPLDTKERFKTLSLNVGVILFER